MTDLGLSEYDAMLLTDDITIARYFEAGITTDSGKKNAKKLTNWINGELARLRNIHQTEVASLKVSATNILELIELIDAGKISGTTAKVIFEEMYNTGDKAEKIMKAKGLEQVQDTAALETAVKKIIAEQTKAVDDYKGGKHTVIQFLIGMVMKELKGKGNVEEIKDMLTKNL
jgi:aspartyl-tRNA(Asn)/glutamyl-tRNA(Gln) amidotransferase subunit B